VSFGTSKVFSSVQEALILALMLVSVFAILYVDMSIMYKVGIVVLVFSMIFLMSLATQILQQQKETAKQQQA
jgi:ABC-type transport system involved in cytochrome c biogenesis permease subunit